MNDEKNPTTTPPTIREILDAFSGLHRYQRDFWLSRPDSFVTYLLDRYPRDFVEAICEGATAHRDDGVESFPVIDAYPGSRIHTVQSLYWIWMAKNAIPWTPLQFIDEVVPETKEQEHAREIKASKAEGRKMQPWRKQHR